MNMPYEPKPSTHGFSDRGEAILKDSDLFQEPSRALFVYSLDGAVKEEDEPLLGDKFIGNWVEGDSSFLFFSEPAKGLLDKLLKLRPELELLDEHHFTYEQWQGGEVERLQVGEFLITAPWVDCETPQGLWRILLDPGVVFGNCLHPTTRDCLSAVAWARKQRPFYHVLDVGTGTGILSLASACLGARSVLAIDLNPLCVKTAARNVARNRMAHVILVKEGTAEGIIDEAADLLVANIHHEVIRILLERRVSNQGDRAILSGLMRSQATEVGVTLKESGYRILREWDHEMTWFTMCAEKT
jgi:ribosomal protein L11 methyltransferase